MRVLSAGLALFWLKLHTWALTWYFSVPFASSNLRLSPLPTNFYFNLQLSVGFGCAGSQIHSRRFRLVFLICGSSGFCSRFLPLKKVLLLGLRRDINSVFSMLLQSRVRDAHCSDWQHTHTWINKSPYDLCNLSLVHTCTHTHICTHTLAQPQPWNVELLGSLDFFACLPQMSHSDWATKQTKMSSLLVFRCSWNTQRLFTVILKVTTT